MKKRNAGAMLFENGASAYAILIAANASSAERFAAAELSHFLHAVSGAVFAVTAEPCERARVLSVGKTARLAAQNFTVDSDALNGDGFVLRTAGDDILIAGANDRGTIYGVYAFLERICGVRFVADDCTHVPRMDCLSLPVLCVTESPAFLYRGMLTEVTYHMRDNLFMTRMRFTHEFNDAMTDEYGGTVSWYTGKNRVHNALQYVPPAEYFDGETGHAELYQIKDGKPIDICYTNGVRDDGTVDDALSVSAVKVALMNMKQAIAASPQYEYYIFGQEDHHGVCGCAGCRKAYVKYGGAGVMIRFVNILARELQAWSDRVLNGKKINLVTFAYFFTLSAPTVRDAQGNYHPIDSTVIPEKNVTIRLAPLGKNFFYPPCHSRQPEQLSDWLIRWRAVTDRFMAWDYTVFYDNVFCFFPVMHTWRQMLADYKKAGVFYMFLQSDSFEYNDWQAQVQCYVASKLLWNPDTDMRPHIEEFFTLYYAPVGKAVLELFDYISAYNACFEAETDGDFSAAINILTAKYQPKDNLLHMLALLDGAQREVDAHPLCAAQKQVLQTRLNRVRLTPLYMLMYNKNEYFESAEKRQAVVDAFFGLCNRLGVTFYGEKKRIDSIKDKYGYKG